VQPFHAINLAHLENIIDDLNRPPWLVQAIIKEMLSCRRFVVDDSWVQLDYSLVSISEVRSLQQPYILLSNFLLRHNIPPSFYGGDISQGLKQLQVFSMYGELIGSPIPNLIPNGRVSPAHEISISSIGFPYSRSSGNEYDTILGMGDNKNVGSFFIIYDQNELYQWHEQYLEDYLSHENAPITADQYQELTSRASRLAGDIVLIVRSNTPPSTAEESNTRRLELKQLYSELSETRERIRLAVLDFHNYAKQNPAAMAAFTSDTPPPLSIFDAVNIIENKIKVRSFVEPLFLRVAHRAAARAEAVRARIATEGALAVLVAEEIEASAESIILSATCLEAFINGVAQDRLDASLWPALEGLRTVDKWLAISSILGVPKCFDKGKNPFQDFDKLVGWRNSLVHYKHKPRQPIEVPGLGTVTALNAICHAANARKAVDTTRAMMTTLTSCLNESTPMWMETTRTRLDGYKFSTSGWLDPI